MHTKAEECNQVSKRWLVIIMLTKDLEVESLQHHLRTFTRLRCQSLMIQTFDPSRPAYRTFASRDELTAEWALHRRHDLYGGFFDDLKMGLEDLWEAYSHGSSMGNA
jgi:hypothetical protein